MTVRTLTKFRNPDRTSDLNERLSTLINKGVFAGGQVTPVAGSLAVDVQPLGAIGADGMITLLEATPERVVVTAGITQYVIMHAEYVANNEPVVAFEVLTQSAFAALNDAERAARFVLAVIDLPTGVSDVDPDLIDVTTSDHVDQQTRSFLRGSVSTITSLPDYTFPPTGDTTQNRVGDVFYAEDERLFYAWQTNPSTSIDGWLQIISTAAEARLDDHKENKDDGTLPPDFFDAQHVKVPFRESHDEGSASTKAMAASGTDFGAGNAIVDELYPIGIRQRIEFTGLSAVTTLLLTGFYYVGTGSIGTAKNFFRLAAAGTDYPLVGSDEGKITITEVRDETGTFQLTPGAPSFDADNIGFYENPVLVLDFTATGDASVSGAVSVLCGARNFAGQVTPHDTLARASFILYEAAGIYYPGYYGGSATFDPPDFDISVGDVRTAIDRVMTEVNKRVARAGDTITVQGISIATALTATGGGSTTSGTTGSGLRGVGGTNSGSGKGGVGVRGVGGDAEGTSGVGVLGEGGQPLDPAALPGAGVQGFGSPGEDDDGGSGVEGNGGNSDNALGGVGVIGTGGPSSSGLAGGGGIVGTGAAATTSVADGGIGAYGTGGAASGLNADGGVGVRGLGGAGGTGTGRGGDGGYFVAGTGTAGPGLGVYGESVNNGVRGVGTGSTSSSIGVSGSGYQAGIYGEPNSATGYGVWGFSDGGGVGVRGEAVDNNDGVQGVGGGTGSGIDAIGGEGSGAGGRFTGGDDGEAGSGGSGVVSIGTKAGAGGQFTGGVTNGIGVSATGDGTACGLVGIGGDSIVPNPGDYTTGRFGVSGIGGGDGIGAGGRFIGSRSNTGGIVAGPGVRTTGGQVAHSTPGWGGGNGIIASGGEGNAAAANTGGGIGVQGIGGGGNLTSGIGGSGITGVGHIGGTASGKDGYGVHGTAPSTAGFLPSAGVRGQSTTAAPGVVGDNSGSAGPGIQADAQRAIHIVPQTSLPSIEGDVSFVETSLGGLVVSTNRMNQIYPVSSWSVDAGGTYSGSGIGSEGIPSDSYASFNLEDFVVRTTIEVTVGIRLTAIVGTVPILFKLRIASGTNRDSLLGAVQMGRIDVASAATAGDMWTLKCMMNVQSVSATQVVMYWASQLSHSASTGSVSGITNCGAGTTTLTSLDTNDVYIGWTVDAPTTCDFLQSKMWKVSR